MATVVNRTTKELRTSVHTPDFSVVDWIINPDLSGVAGVPNRYWNIVGDIISEMSAAEKAVVDQAEADAQETSERDASEAEADINRLTKAITLITLDEINILRAQHSLADRTATQLQNAIKARIQVI